MPENERPPTTQRLIGWRPDGAVDLDATLEILERGDLVVEGRMPWSSNLTYLVTLTGDGDVDGSRTIQGVYKPGQGERPLWDFPGYLYRREIAAYLLAQAVGWPMVPPTIAREDGPFGPGSLQLFIDCDYEEHYFTLFEGGDFHSALQTMCAFDVIVNNADRKGGHVLRGSDDHIWGVDHGVCFHLEPKLRTVIWDYAGEPIPPMVHDDLVALAGNIPFALEQLLSGSECQALVERIDHFIAAGCFPEPIDDHHPPYPWPLI